MKAPAQIDNPVLIEHAEAIRNLGKRVIKDVIEIGRRLAAAKELCGHGNWLPWLDREFGWEETTARRFMSVYELAGKSGNLQDLSLPVSAIYLLAAPSTPDEARDEIIKRAEAGERCRSRPSRKRLRKRAGSRSPAPSPKRPRAARTSRKRSTASFAGATLIGSSMKRSV
jgi:hypothetical protein